MPAAPPQDGTSPAAPPAPLPSAPAPESVPSPAPSDPLREAKDPLSTDTSRADTSASTSPWTPFEIRRFDSTSLRDPVGSRTGRRPRRVSTDTAEEAPTDFRIDGTKTLRVGIGDDGAIDLRQTLDLDAEGEIAKDVHLRAHLSDQDVPLTAGGSSASLREIDQIFIEGWTPRFYGRLGDLEIVQDENALLGGFSRSGRGATSSWHPGGWSIQGAGGAPRALWRRLEFAGVEGRQEGYSLTGSGSLFGVFVLPGSERVTIDGEPMRRGEDADYVVRYAEGLLDFTPRRRITASQRIAVEFQYTDLDYARRMVAGEFVDTLGRLAWRVFAAREGDDATQPISYAGDSLSRAILREAGNDPERAAWPDSSSIPLPTSLGQAGAAAAWGDSSFRVAVDLRVSQSDSNTASSRGDTLVADAQAAEMRTAFGEYLDDGGLGRFRLRISGWRLSPEWNSFEAIAPLEEEIDRKWNRGGRAFDPARGLHQGEGELGWMPAESWSASVEGGGREEGDDRYARARGVAAWSPDPRRLAELVGEYARADEDGGALERRAARLRLVHGLGQWTPRLRFEGEDRQSPGPVGRGRRSWGEIAAGTSWRWERRSIEADADWSERLDRVRPGDPHGEPADSARTTSVRVRAARPPGPPWSWDVAVDWRRIRRNQPGGTTADERSWLGAAHSTWIPLPGISTDASWKLSLASWRPEIAVYDTVPPGTGEFRYDSATGEYQRRDDGDLILIGVAIDTAAPALHTTSRSASLEAEISPGQAWPELTGLLADIGARARADWEEQDSSDVVRFWPHVLESDLARSVLGRSELEFEGWWERGRQRLSSLWNRQFSSLLPARSVPGAEREVITTTSLRSRTRLRESDLLEIELRREELDRSFRTQPHSEIASSAEASWAFHPVPSLELRPSTLAIAGEGQTGTGPLRRSTTISPAAALRLSFLRAGVCRAEYRFARVEAEVDPGYRMSGGFVRGDTHRLQTGIEWIPGEHASFSLDYLVRIEPVRPLFQRLTAEAKAFF